MLDQVISDLVQRGILSEETSTTARAELEKEIHRRAKRLAAFTAFLQFKDRLVEQYLVTKG